MNIGEADYKKIILRKWKQVLQQSYSYKMLGELKLDIMDEPFLKGLLLRVTHAIAAEIVDEISAIYPKDWWQAVKQRFAPNWVLKRWPVRLITVTLTARACYPKISLRNETESYLSITRSSYTDDDDYS